MEAAMSDSLLLFITFWAQVLFFGGGVEGDSSEGPILYTLIKLLFLGLRVMMESRWMKYVDLRQERNQIERASQN